MAFLILLAFIAGWFLGWCHAHMAVADECKKLGRFYVSNTTYECTAIRRTETNNGKEDEDDHK